MFRVCFHFPRLVFFFFSASAGAFPLPANVTPAQRAEIERHRLSTHALAGGADFEGIIKLSNCSGSVVRFLTAKDSDPALVLTNGHCTGGIAGNMIPAGKAYINKKDSRKMEILNAKSGKPIASFRAVRIVYATMTGTDLALFEMNATYADLLKNYNLRALTMADHPAPVGTAIDIVSGYWDTRYQCSIGAIIGTLHEAAYVWHESMRYSQPGCDVIHGTSGSPIIQSGTRDVIGINNTGNDKGQMCKLNNPCEVDADGKTHATKGLSYGQQTYVLYACLNAQNQFNFSLPGCGLNHAL